MAQRQLKTVSETGSTTQRTTFHMNPILYRALRIKLMGEGKTVTRWLHDKMIEEVSVLLPEDDDELTAEKVFGEKEENDGERTE
jgi:hypothetical protein